MYKVLDTQDTDTEFMQSCLDKIYPQHNLDLLYPFWMFRKLSSELDSTLDVFFAKHNLSVGRFTILTFLHSSEEGLMPSELALRLGVTQATISGLISSLEKSHLIKKETHKKDGRAYVIKLSDIGLETVKKIIPEYFAYVEKFMSSLEQNERELFSSLTGKLLKNV